MPTSARCCALLLSLLASPGFAQADGPMPRAALPRALAAERRAPPDLRILTGDLRPDARSAPGSASAAMSLGDGMELGIGRFAVLELTRSPSHMEAVPRPMDMRRRERSIAAVRWSFSF